MKCLILFFILIISSSCAQVVNKQTMLIRPGEVKWLEIGVEGEKISLRCRERPIRFVLKNGKLQTFIMESYFSDSSPYTCQVLSGDNLSQEISFQVEAREYPSETLRVNPKTVKLSPKDEERVMKEQAMLNKIYASSANKFLFESAFEEPMKTQKTSLYGTRRVYNKQKKGQHLGIDYRAFVGDKVPATTEGVVVFAGDLFYTGFTVIIDHGLDIFSVYGHLSKTMVNTGETVKRGQLIGLSGNTGRTSGPHLHWGVKVQGQYIDGLVLIDESKKNFKK